MITYLDDYHKDLLKEGYSESEAAEMTAKEELRLLDEEHSISMAAHM